MPATTELSDTHRKHKQHDGNSVRASGFRHVTLTRIRKRPASSAEPCPRACHVYIVPRQHAMQAQAATPPHSACQNTTSGRPRDNIPTTDLTNRKGEMRRPAVVQQPLEAAPRTIERCRTKQQPRSSQGAAPQACITSMHRIATARRYQLVSCPCSPTSCCARCALPPTRPTSSSKPRGCLPA